MHFLYRFDFKVKNEKHHLKHYTKLNKKVYCVFCIKNLINFSENFKNIQFNFTNSLIFFRKFENFLRFILNVYQTTQN